MLLYHLKKQKVIFLLLLGLSGCSSTPDLLWVGKNPNSDMYECQREAALIFPVAMYQTTLGVGYSSPVNTSCYTSYGITNCHSSGGQYIPPQQITLDANSKQRNNFIHNCMSQKGNILVKASEAQALIQQLNQNTNRESTDPNDICNDPKLSKHIPRCG